MAANAPTLPLTATTTVGIAAGSKLTRNPRVLTAMFGDGYTQRVPDGINALPSTLEVRFTNMRRGEALNLDGFFLGLGGYKPFKYTLPGESTPRQWLCPKWDRSFDNRVIESMTATFEENFDP